MARKQPWTQQQGSFFVVFRGSVDGMRLAHTGEAICLVTQSTNSGTQLFQKHPARHTQRECLTNYLGILLLSHIHTWNFPYSYGKMEFYYKDKAIKSLLTSHRILAVFSATVKESWFMCRAGILYIFPCGVLRLLLLWPGYPVLYCHLPSGNSLTLTVCVCAVHSQLSRRTVLI